jgi:hypothetical protein
MYESVPQELKSLPNWVGWKLETRDGKPTKVPYSKTNVKAATDNPSHWRKFEDVCNIISSKEKGIGFVFDGNGITGIDLDYCFNLDGTILAKFKEVLSTLNSYTEISPSGNGLHIFIKCKEIPYYSRDLPTDEYPEGKEHFGKKKNNLEIYSKVRYFTITGIRWNGCPPDIKEYTLEEIYRVCDSILKISRDDKQTTPIVPTSAQLSDDEIINIASKAQNAQKFDSLMSGSKSEYNNDDSAADMALASLLSFYSDDPNQIERIMRRSGLRRSKWDNHKTYLKSMTIQKAIRDCTARYDPNRYGSVEEGKEIFKNMVVNTQTFIKKKQKPQEGKTTTVDKKDNSILVPIKPITEEELERIKKSLCDDLPPFPQITHPLFKKWMEVGGRLMYSHKSYHFGNLLAIASMALGRYISVLISTKHIYTNCNVMLVGTSTISGKSFSSDTAINEFGEPVTSIPPTILDSKDKTELKRKSISNPRLIQDMSNTNNVLWYYDEAKEFFDDCGDRGWNAPIIGTLCTAYDGGVLEKSLSNANTKKDGVDRKWICENPFLSLLFNMTITQLKEASTPKILSSGFLFRWMWFVENGGEKKRNVSASEQDMKEVNEIKKELCDVCAALKKLHPDDICFTVNDKIEQWSLDISKTNNDENFQSATGRGVIHIYKIAMIFSLFDKEFQKKIFNQPKYPIKVELENKWVDEAINIVENYLLPRMLKVVDFSDKVDINNKQQRVLNDLKSAGGVELHSKLLNKTKLDASDFRKSISTLVECEQIERTELHGKSAYKLKI